MPEIITHGVSAVGFSFYSEDEIKKLSVKRITAPYVFDNLNQPIPDGLNDRAFGPVEKFDNCETCHLGYEQCSGHVGHIEISVPVYHPLLFNLMTKILKGKCMNCHKFRIPPLQSLKLMAKFKFLRAGLVQDATTVDQIFRAALTQNTRQKREMKKKLMRRKKKKKKKAEDSDSSSSDSDDEILDPVTILKSLIAIADAKGRSTKPLSIARSLRDTFIREFFKLLTAAKSCHNCHAMSPRLRSDSSGKIFALPLSGRSKQANNSNGIKIKSVLKPDEEFSVTAQHEEKMAKLLSKEERKQAKKRAAKKKEKEASSSSEEEEEQESDSDEEMDAKPPNPHLMFPHEVQKHLELLWKEEAGLLGELWGSFEPIVKYQLPQNDYNIFFLRTLCVPPPRFRPPAQITADLTSDHPQNVYFKKIIVSDLTIRRSRLTQNNADAEDLKKLSNSAASAWLEMQDAVNCLMDSTKTQASGGPSTVPQGIRQILEKKEGLFRRHMMGKRVNFAARSVISPDPFLHCGQIGVPEVFAVKLTYPTPVTTFNVESLRRAVINGPDVHPGANSIIDESGREISLSCSREQRIAYSKTLLTSDIKEQRRKSRRGNQGIGVKKVLRHLISGDVLLVNRQPTLHKPSMMAHRARVLKGQRTIRMHYANCNTYNADFDGDEMNLHFPQNELARVEAYDIANTENQYIVPTDGSPLRGLIQDHVVSGVLLTKMDSFFTRSQFHQLVYSCCNQFIKPEDHIETPIPCIIKPEPLWSGKQLVSSVIQFITKVGAYGDNTKLNYQKKTQVPGSTWNTFKQEGLVIMHQSELVQGILDKSQFGAKKYGLVHSCFQLYGPDIAGDLLSCLSQLFTIHLQSYGHTCGIGDVMLVSEADAERQKIIQQSARVGAETARKFANVPLNCKYDTFLAAMQHSFRQPDAGVVLDSMMSTAMSNVTTNIIRACLPGGQVKAFPENCMDLMITSGAKGSKVNFSQISCLLGQQALEGRRVPLMASGKSLPSFPKYDATPRAGGFVSQRFLTGIRPQEYYFHCMAGREGLVDTAVKTANSGYLQRCLIKHLESLVVAYDYSVRDSDGSIVQFQYGEDAIDVTKTSYLTKFDFLSENMTGVVKQIKPNQAIQAYDVYAVEDYKNDMKEDEHSDPVLSHFNPGRVFGAVSEKFESELDTYINKNLSQEWDEKKTEQFRALMNLNYARSIISPGESVGVICGQSIGEPSTQMTLNTFHLAGHGGANVTLGIPRLREIIMTASDSIKTPIMEIPLVHQSEKTATEVAGKLSSLKLIDFLTNMTLNEVVSPERGTRAYHLKLFLWESHDEHVSSRNLESDDFLACIETKFTPRMNYLIRRQCKARAGTGTKALPVGAGKKSTEDDEQEVKSSRKGPPLPGSELAAKAQRKKEELVSYGEADDEDKAAMAAELAREAREEETEENEVGEEEREQERAAAHDRRSRICNKCMYVSTIKDNTKGRASKTLKWVEITFELGLSMPKMLLMGMAEEVCDQVLLRSIGSLGKCVPMSRRPKDGKPKEWVVQAAGVDFREIWNQSYQLGIDADRLYSNDIGAIRRAYGVEAARHAITHEIGAVFGVYGISVDNRHLGLLADYMTQGGGYRSLNFIGMRASASPFQKISFETSMNFILDSCNFGDVDNMIAPSSQIVLGAPVNCGTGGFEVRQDLTFRPTQ